MTTVAVIPARGGSKGIPRKNLAIVGGRTLIERSITACLAASAVDVVIVSSDDEEILAVASEAGADIVLRPASLSGDEASSESAVLHALEARGITGDRSDVVVLVQCTSPFIDPRSLDSAIGRVLDGEADVVFSAVCCHDFLWRVDGTSLEGVNHSRGVRHRRQDRPAEFLETGAFYAMRASMLRASGHRFFGTVAAEIVDSRHRLQIDEPSDLDLARALAARFEPPVMEFGHGVDALVTDFDGVHTDNTSFVDEHGTESVRVNRGDGLGLALLANRGVDVLVLTTERNPVVRARAAKLGVFCIDGSSDKLSDLRAWAVEHGHRPDRIVYVGNDVNDLDCLNWVGHPVVVGDAHPSLLFDSRVAVTSRAGGDGAVREVADAILATNGSNSSHQCTNRTRSSTT